VGVVPSLSCLSSHPFTFFLPKKKSIYIRENSIEYNQPTIQPAKSTTILSTILCCGHSPTDLSVRDSISTVYYDDMLFDNVKNDTRKCHAMHTFCCGGRGEAVRLESTFCGEACYRARGMAGGGCCCLCCVPVCCPGCCCPCAVTVSLTENGLDCK
jgi:hypothetical protein